MSVFGYPQRPEEGAGSPGAGVADGCETPGVGTESYSPVFFKSNKYS